MAVVLRFKTPRRSNAHGRFDVNTWHGQARALHEQRGTDSDDEHTSRSHFIILTRTNGRDNLAQSTGATVASDFFRIASAWAAQGFGVFPLVPGTKKPRAGSRGIDEATTDLAQIAAWGDENPQYEVGVAPDTGGCFVLDIDTKNGKEGDASLLALELEHGNLPDSNVFWTPSGGRHIWFKGRVRSSVETLAPGIDTRGIGGYVRVLEPLLGFWAPQPSPSWIPLALEPKERQFTSTEVELDEPVNVERFRQYLEREPGPREGQGSDAQCLKVAAAGKDYGLSPAKIAAMMCEWAPGFDPWWVESKVEHAWAYGQNEPGAKAMEQPAKIWDIGALTAWTPPTPLASSGPNESQSRYRLLSEAEQDALQPPEWCVEGWFPKTGTALLYGAPGSYKSFVATELAMSRAAGMPFYGAPGASGVSVVYAAGEGAIGLGKKRRPAWRWARGVQGPLPMYLSDLVPPADIKEATAFAHAIDAKGLKPGLIILDTASRMMAPAGLDENAAKDVGRFLQVVEALEEYFRPCLVVVIHHAGKDSGRGARGSSNLPAGFDVVMHVEADKETIVATVTVDKQKDAEEPRPLKLRGEKVADSLVFSPMTDAEASALEAVTDTRLNKKDVTRVLQSLGAYGTENGVATRVLATAIVVARELDLAPDAQERAVRVVVKELERVTWKRDLTFQDGSWGIAQNEREL